MLRGVPLSPVFLLVLEVMVVYASSSKAEEAPGSAWRPVRKGVRDLRRDLGLVGLGQSGVGAGVGVDLGALLEEGGAREGARHPAVASLNKSTFLFSFGFNVVCRWFA